MRNRAGVLTRALLLSEAERMFAERGVENVALRDITAATDTNIAAINYHFGSKRGLIEVLVERGAGEYARRRARFLDALEASGAENVDLRHVVEALVVPTAEMVSNAADGRYYAQFLSRLATHPEFLPLVNKAYDPHTNRYLALLARATPHLDDDVRLLRFVAAKELVNQFVGESSERLPAWLNTPTSVSFDQTVAALVDMLVGLFSAPTTGGAKSAKL